MNPIRMHLTSAQRVGIVLGVWHISVDRIEAHVLPSFFNQVRLFAFSFFSFLLFRVWDWGVGVQLRKVVFMDNMFDFVGVLLCLLYRLLVIQRNIREKGRDAVELSCWLFTFNPAWMWKSSANKKARCKLLNTK